jgi:hypothetical protein
VPRSPFLSLLALLVPLRAPGSPLFGRFYSVDSARRLGNLGKAQVWTLAYNRGGRGTRGREEELGWEVCVGLRPLRQPSCPQTDQKCQPSLQSDREPEKLVAVAEQSRQPGRRIRIDRPRLNRPETTSLTVRANLWYGSPVDRSAPPAAAMRTTSGRCGLGLKSRRGGADNRVDKRGTLC